eukprot:7781128-Pyramimonas_sp.AAC.1
MLWRCRSSLHATAGLRTEAPAANRRRRRTAAISGATVRANSPWGRAMLKVRVVSTPVLVFDTVRIVQP